MVFIFIGRVDCTSFKPGYKITDLTRLRLNRLVRSDPSARPVRPVGLGVCQFWLSIESTVQISLKSMKYCMSIFFNSSFGLLRLLSFSCLCSFVPDILDSIERRQTRVRSREQAAPARCCASRRRDACSGHERASAPGERRRRGSAQHRRQRALASCTRAQQVPVL